MRRLLPIFFVVGCGSGVPTMGMLGIPTMARVASNVVLVDASLDGHPGSRLLADTGSPFTLVDATSFPGAALPSTEQVTIDLTFGAVTIDDITALQASFMTNELAGIVGGDVMRSFSMAFDYRGKTLRFGDGDSPADVEPGTSIAFSLSGGGTVSGIKYPATRIPVDVEIEGAVHPFVLDTGASEVTVRSDLYAQLVGDGRAQLTGYDVGTVSGEVSGMVTRAKEISVGGEAVMNQPVLTIGDDLIGNLSSELGRPIEGLLGGTFLREFFVTIDYPSGSVRFQRYPTRAHIVDEFQRIGIAIAPDSSHYVVSAVYSGSDADTQQLSVGDEVLSIDGAPLAGMDPLEADALLEGAVGVTHELTLGSTSATALNGKTITVRVDDLIPVP